jgi:flavin reductase (DIM6/NTAB) family NADH-FMN oxidoreductase RutF
LTEEELKQSRKNFGHFATGVAVATTIDKKGCHNAITINSLTSLSLIPALILFCIDNKSDNLKAFKKNKFFALNILSSDQINLSKEFAKSENQLKWGAEPHDFSKTGCPFFINSIGYFECRKEKVIKSGDHHIIIGKVQDFIKLNDKKPLIYYQGQYQKLF